MKFILLISGMFFSIQIAMSQVQWEEKELDLAFFADVMVNARDASHRERAANEFRSIMGKVLAEPENRQYTFERIPWISTIIPQDSSFRLFTWQWEKNPGELYYEGAIRLKDGQTHWLKNLTDEPSDIEYLECNSKKWLGQVYYNMHEYKVGEQIEYLLFGYRKTGTGFIIKTAEPLTILDGQIIFGKELFFDDKRHGKTRLTLKYSDNSTASLNFNEDLGKIVYDNIVSIINPYESGAIRLVPEGTYKAYEFKNGKWYFEENILNTRYEEPPVQSPDVTEPKKDIFGR